ncbi:MAG: SapC family protein [Nitrospirae bacterium]|nr:MAG: SapC family protein [Nitrospirota bacterium]
MDNTALPMFYKNPVALNSETHAKTTIAPSPNGLAFAANTHSVILAGVEFAEACREFPIIFALSGNNTIIPFALLGVQANENLFVSREGKWLGRYVPAYIRRYPFINTEGDNQQRVVCVDDSYDGCNLKDGQPLFEGGEPTEYLKQVMALLEDYYVQMKITEALGQHLKQLDLLKPMDANIQLGDGRTFNMSGLLVVDEQRLLQLDKDSVEALFRSGVLALVYSHLLSLRNLARLVEMKEGC